MAVEWWIVALLGGLPLVALVLGTRLRAARALPSVDPAQLVAARRRARVLRGAAIATVGCLVAAAATLSTRPVDALAGFVARGQSTVVVLDVSSSVGDIVFSQIANTLRAVVDTTGTSGRLGLVLFSDVAQEALPPGTRAAQLLPFIRYYEPVRERGVRVRPSKYQFTGPGVTLIATQYPINPWLGAFSGGTQISTGLRAGREALEREAGGSGRIVLISDLQEAEEDRGKMLQELVAFSRSSAIELRVIALPPATSGDMVPFRRILGNDDYVVSSTALEQRSSSSHPTGIGLPLALLAVLGGLALTIAACELVCPPLAWGRKGSPVAAP
jgi:hypothetical protein